MFLGGTLIKRFDGFRRLCRRAAEEYRHPLTVTDSDMMLVNRVLAGMGGPPASSQIKGQFESDGLPLLLLFLLTQEIECKAGLIGNTEPVMARVKNLVHLLSHAAYPLLSEQAPLPFQDVVKELGSSGAVLRPLVRYDDADGEPLSIDLIGAQGRLRVGAEHGPYTLAVLLGADAGPAPLAAPTGGLHPTVLVLP